MNSDFQRGVKIGLFIYGIGIVLTIIVHLIFGWDYAHSPPTSAIPLFLTLVAGGLRLLLTAFYDDGGTITESEGRVHRSH